MGRQCKGQKGQARAFEDQLRTATAGTASLSRLILSSYVNETVKLVKQLTT